ncbi:MAG: alpha-N-arabinofuranosidase [Crenarchaeota archaeon]|nr:alpha-N-arabinofuranosidase [Thermoproteota archaeon]MDW8034082.1 alpha-L-arabinofuranosidase C-terminal domain-containing protein [Nitrososphaerota archaeon]
MLTIAFKANNVLFTKHKRKTFLLILFSAIIITLLTYEFILKGVEKSLNVEILVSNNMLGKIDPKIYGHFIEHVGRCIYGGVWVGEDSPLPNLRGLRLDVLKATRAIKPPIIRWPGGNFASGYHWKDGIGPRSKRPLRTNPAWGGFESNQFGTDEFIDFCREVGAEPLIVVNMGSGTPQEAAEWVEYCNGDLNTTYGKLRAENGHPEPYNVKYWMLGNEMYGEWQIGHMDADTYAKTAVDFANAMKSIDPSIKLIAVGWFGTSSDSFHWNKKVLESAGDYIDYLSLHTYCWKPRYDDYYTIVNYPLNVEEDLKKIVELINSLMKDKPGKSIKIALTEWGVWYENATSGLTQSVRLCDGLLAAGMFHVFHRLCNNVTMANFAQLVNALPAIVTDDNGSIYVNPIYLVFKLYRDNTGEIVLKTSVRGALTSVLDVSATMDENGKYVYLAVINKDPEKKVSTKIILEGFNPKNIFKVSQLNGPGIFSTNNFESPDVVKITEAFIEIDIKDNYFIYNFDPHSITILVLERAKEITMPSSGGA